MVGEIGGLRVLSARLARRLRARWVLPVAALVSVPAVQAASHSYAQTTSPVIFRIEQFEDPQPTDILFSKSWPRLIDENNRESTKFFPSLKPKPGHNAALSLTIAKVPISSGEVTISIYTGPFPHCQGVGETHNMEPGAIPCPARMTVRRGDEYQTVDLGWVCRVGPVTSSSGAAAFYDEKSNAIHLSAMVAGKLVNVAGDGVPCDRVIPLG